MLNNKLFQIILTLLLPIITLINQDTKAQVLEQDSLALVALYDSTDGDNWTDNENWLNGPVPTWSNINVNGNRVTVINMYRNNVTGKIPIEIGDLNELSYLQLGENHLSGTIPDEIGNLTNLRTLYLFVNQLEGTIPASIANLINLEYLVLSENNLTGSIPQGLGSLSNLKRLAIFMNNISGSIPLDLGNLVKLERMELWDNQLTGSIPIEIGKIDSLEVLKLTKNNLTGTLPSELGNLSNLKTLHLNENQLEGKVPEELNNLAKLEALVLNENQLTELPDLSQLTALIYLIVQSNKFTFEDIELNIGIATTFTYSPQDSIGIKQDTAIDIGSSITFITSAGGKNTNYQWMKDGSEISNAEDSSYTIDAAESTNTGEYICKVSNTIATDLTLFSRPFNLTVRNPVGLQDKSVQIPDAFILHQNYPNPFNPSATIKYEIPKESYVTLKVYDILGRELATLVNEQQKVGYYEVKFNAMMLTSGIYFYRIQAWEFVNTKKMILLR